MAATVPVPTSPPPPGCTAPTTYPLSPYTGYLTLPEGTFYVCAGRISTTTCTPTELVQTTPKAVSQTTITAASATATPNTVYSYLINRAGAVTLNLPAVAGLTAGTRIEVKDISGNASTNNITIDANGSETIDGALTFVINTNYESVTLETDGTAWYSK